MSDSEWRTPYHEICEREVQRAEAVERRGPWVMPVIERPALAELAREDMDRERAE